MLWTSIWWTIIEVNEMDMLAPPHPGEIIAEDVLKPLGVSVTEAAQALGVGRQALSAVLNGRAKLTPEMAVRIEKSFGPKWEVMMRLQLQYDVAEMRKHVKDIKVTKRFTRRAA
jgi:addiction module HigA family antidote